MLLVHKIRQTETVTRLLRVCLDAFPGRVAGPERELAEMRQRLAAIAIAAR
jgi:hypothetical protein